MGTKTKVLLKKEYIIRLIGIFLILSLTIIYGSISAIAHGDEEEMPEEAQITIKPNLLNPINLIKLTAIWFVAIAIIAILTKNNTSDLLKRILFWSITIPVVLLASYLAGHTIYLNVSSITKGPVHWHADTIITLCGKDSELIDPKGLNNKVGSSVLHEHNDGRIHVEGVVQKLEDVNLGKYFESIGGALHRNHIMYPTPEGLIQYQDDDICPDGTAGTLKVYVNGKRIDYPHEYVPAPETNVPPGDCIVFEFGPGNSETTDKICKSWQSEGWTYESINEKSERDFHSGDNSDTLAHGMHASPELGQSLKVGPGESAHIHKLDLSKFRKIEDIAKNPEDVPAPIDRDYSDTVKVSLHATEVISEIAPNITFHYWTYNNTIPGPMIRVREDDIVELTLSNDITSIHNHSIDLHAVNGPGGGASLTQVEPGQSKTIRFKALNQGEYVYHCATPNVAMHMANGMYGLIVVEPKKNLPKVDKEFYVMQGELYTVGATGQTGFQSFDPKKMFNEKPDYVVFNGRVKSLVDNPMKADVGDKVRMFVGNGGVSLISSFHVIGEIFDKVYIEGSSNKSENIQTTIVPAGGAAMVEFNVEVPGNYVIVDHALSRLDKGAWGILKAEGNENPMIYSAYE